MSRDGGGGDVDLDAPVVHFDAARCDDGYGRRVLAKEPTVEVRLLPRPQDKALVEGVFRELFPGCYTDEARREAREAW